jgi:hypothetical protein
MTCSTCKYFVNDQCALTKTPVRPSDSCDQHDPKK